MSSFADDTRVLKVVSSIHEKVELQSDLAKLHSWVEHNNMSLNNNKIECKHCSPRVEFDEYLASDGSSITIKEQAEHLGIILGSALLHSHF